MRERWLPIPGWESSYAVSDQGRVRSLDRVVRLPKARGVVSQPRSGAIMALGESVAGYQQVNLYADGSAKRMLVHRLVALAFIGPCPAGMEVCHGDGDKKNNALPNLRYGTRRENAADKKAHGTAVQGKKLDASDAASIRTLLGQGSSQREVARRFGISQAAVSKIHLRHWWKHDAPMMKVCVKSLEEAT